MSLRYFFLPFLLFFIAVMPAAGQAVADFTFSDISDMPSSLLKNSVQGAPDALSINERARSDGEGVYTLNDPDNPDEHVNIDLKISKDMLEPYKSIYMEWDYKNVEGEGQSAWLIFSGEENHFGIFHHSEAGFVIRYYTLDEGQAGAAADPFLTGFIPFPVAVGERETIGFHYNQEEGMAYLYKDGQEIWRTTDSQHEDGTPFEPTPGQAFYYFTEGETLTVGANMNAGWTESPTLYRFRVFSEACSDDSPPTIVEEETIKEICSGESATLVATANEAEAYQWYSGSSPDNLSKIEGATESRYETEPLSAPQNFWVTVMRGPCESQPEMVTVSINELPTMPEASDVEHCGPAALELQASSSEQAVTFQWYKADGESLEAIPGATSSTYTTEYLRQPATYFVTTINEKGCESEARKVEAIIYEIPGIPVVNVQPEVICGSGKATVIIDTPAGKNFTYNWYKDIDESSLIEEKTSNSITLEVSKDTSFYVRAVNNGCLGPQNRVTITVSPIPSIEASINGSATILKGESASLSAIFDADSIDESSLRWEPAASLEQPFSKTSMASPPFTTTYTVYAKSVDGCPISDTLTVFVVDEFPVTNAFSPNGDGYQDTWEIHNLDQDKYSNCKVMVFNSWGNRVFYSEGYSRAKEWDGTYKGQPLPTGTYYYTIHLNESTKPLRGSLFILR